MLNRQLPILQLTSTIFVSLQHGWPLHRHLPSGKYHNYNQQLINMNRTISWAYGHETAHGFSHVMQIHYDKTQGRYKIPRPTVTSIVLDDTLLSLCLNTPSSSPYASFHINNQTHLYYSTAALAVPWSVEATVHTADGVITSARRTVERRQGEGWIVRRRCLFRWVGGGRLVVGRAICQNWCQSRHRTDGLAVRQCLYGWGERRWNDMWH